MAKKQVEIKPEIEVVWSEKYGCNITKANAVFDPAQNSWVNEFIESTYKK